MIDGVDDIAIPGISWLKLAVVKILNPAVADVGTENRTHSVEPLGVAVAITYKYPIALCSVRHL